MQQINVEKQIYVPGSGCSDDAIGYWMPPEQLEPSNKDFPEFSDRSDMFGYGIIVYEMAYRNRPYNEDQINRNGIGRMIRRVRREIIREIDNEVDSADYLRFLLHLIKLNQIDRISSAEAVIRLEKLLAATYAHKKALADQISLEALEMALGPPRLLKDVVEHKWEDIKALRAASVGIKKIDKKKEKRGKSCSRLFGSCCGGKN